MSGHSWRYTVNIPLWILGKDTEGESVALYRVNVILQPPDSTELTSRPPYFVLRRYSQFRQLHSELKAAYPDEFRDARDLAPPPKHTLAALGGAAQHKDLLDRRRAELERWMWALISHPALARSQLLRAFLDFDKALARGSGSAPQLAAGSGYSSPLPPSSPYTAAGGAATPGAASSSSMVMAPGAAAPGSSGGGGSSFGGYSGGYGSHGHGLVFAAGSTGPTSAASSEAGDWDQQQQQGFDKLSEAGPQYSPRSVLHLSPITTTPAGDRLSITGNSQLAADGGGGSMMAAAGGVAGAGGVMRLGLRLEQRSDVRRLVDLLSRRIRQAGDDLAAAVAEASGVVEGDGISEPTGGSSNEVNLLQFENELLRGDVGRMQKELTALQGQQHQQGGAAGLIRGLTLGQGVATQAAMAAGDGMRNMFAKFVGPAVGDQHHQQQQQPPGATPAAHGTGGVSALGGLTARGGALGPAAPICNDRLASLHLTSRPQARAPRSPGHMGQSASTSAHKEIGKRLLAAAKIGDAEEVAAVCCALHRDPLLLLYANYQGCNVVHYAAQHGRLEVLKLLIGIIRQHAAALSTQLEMMLQLEGQSKEMSVAARIKQLHQPRLPWCSRSQAVHLFSSEKVLPTLLSWRNHKGVTPLMVAARAGHAQCLALLLSEGADPLALDKVARRFVDIRTTSGFSALHYASYWGNGQWSTMSRQLRAPRLADSGTLGAQAAWEGVASLDPRAVRNTMVPLQYMLQAGGAANLFRFGVPMLEALAKSVLDRHLTDCLDTLEGVEEVDKLEHEDHEDNAEIEEDGETEGCISRTSSSMLPLDQQCWLPESHERPLKTGQQPAGWQPSLLLPQTSLFCPTEQREEGSGPACLAGDIDLLQLPGACGADGGVGRVDDGQGNDEEEFLQCDVDDDSSDEVCSICFDAASNVQLAGQGMSGFVALGLRQA
eukprot:gene3235-3512_t